MKINEFTDYQMPTELDYNIMDDIHYFMINDPNFYRKHYFPTIDKAKKDGNNSTIRPLIDTAINLYFKQFDVKARPDRVIKDEDKESLQQRIIDTEAEVLWKLKRYDEAIIAIEKAISIDPENNYFLDQKQKFKESKNNDQSV